MHPEIRRNVNWSGSRQIDSQKRTEERGVKNRNLFWIILPRLLRIDHWEFDTLDLMRGVLDTGTLSRKGYKVHASRTHTIARRYGQVGLSLHNSEITKNDIEWGWMEERWRSHTPWIEARGLGSFGGLRKLWSPKQDLYNDKFGLFWRISGNSCELFRS